MFKDKLIKFIPMAFCLLVVGVVGWYVSNDIPSSKYDYLGTYLVKMGSRGQDVRDVQTKLKAWGYYKGSVDGKYGSATRKAVIAFQKRNGLRADGKVGDSTAKALGIKATSKASTKVSRNNVARSDQSGMLAHAINGEARGEPFIGQVAVGAVILNRVSDPKFPKTIAAVIYQPGAFTAVSDGQMYTPLEVSPQKAAKDALNGWDPSGGAIYYYNPATATNKWIWSRPLIKIIGKHYFCK